MSTFWLEFSARRVWDYPIGFRRDYPINSSPGAAQVGLSYRFRFDRRTEYGTIQLVPKREKAGTGFGIPRQASIRPTSMGLSYRIRRDYPIDSCSCGFMVWDYPIGLTGTIRLMAWDYPIGFHGLSYCRVRPDRCRQ